MACIARIERANRQQRPEPEEADRPIQSAEAVTGARADGSISP
jgi:hypothetical protein